MTKDRVYNLGVDSEELRIRWTTALTVAYNDALLSQADYKIDTVLHLVTDEVRYAPRLTLHASRPTRHSPRPHAPRATRHAPRPTPHTPPSTNHQVQDLLASFKKELEVFERLSAMDRNMSRVDVTDGRKAGNVERILQAEDLMEVMKFLADEAKSTGTSCVACVALRCVAYIAFRFVSLRALRRVACVALRRMRCVALRCVAPNPDANPTTPTSNETPPGLTEDITKVIHQLVTLPMDCDFGKLAWETLSQAINDIRANKHRKGSYRVEYERLQKLVDKRRDLDQKIKDSESAGEMMAAKDREIADLKANGGGGGGGGGRGGGGGGCSALGATRPRGGGKVPVAIKDDPLYTKYFKMLKMHLPKMAVAMKATADGVDPAILDLDPNSPSPSGLMTDGEGNASVASAGEASAGGGGGNPLAAMIANKAGGGVGGGGGGGDPNAGGGAKLKDDPKYAKYFKMLKMHLPPQAVKNKMQAEGLDPAVLDMDPEKPAPGGGGGAAKPAPMLFKKKGPSKSGLDRKALVEIGLEEKPKIKLEAKVSG